MKTAFLTLLFGLTLCAASPQEEVRSTLDTWGKALVNRDAAALGKLYHTELTYEHSSAKTETKAEAIEAVMKAANPYVLVEFHEPSIRVFGNMALVKGVVDINTSAAKNHLDALFVLIKTGGNWQIVARQATKIP